MKKKLFLVSCAFATVFGASAQNALKLKSTPRVTSHSENAHTAISESHIANSKEEYTVKTHAKTRGTSNVTDTLALVDYRKQYGRPGRYVNTNGTWSYNGLNAGIRLKQYPTYQSTTGQTDNLGMIIKFPTKQATKLKGAGVVMAALNSAGSTVDVNFYGKKTAGGQFEFLGTVQKTVAASNSYAAVWFNLPTSIDVADTFEIEVSPASAKDSIIVSTTGALGVNQAKFKGSISGTTLTATLSQGGIANALEIVGAGVTPGTKVLYQTGYNTWLLDKSQTVASTAAPIDMTQNPVAFDDVKTFYMVYQTSAAGALEDQYISYISYDATNKKPYVLDAYVYPVVDYTWNTVAPTVTVTGATATAVSTLSGYTTDLLFSRAAFFKKYWATAGKTNGEYYSLLRSGRTGKKDTLDNTTDLTTTYNYTASVTDTIFANEVMRGYGFAKRPVYTSNLSTAIFTVNLCTKPAVPTFTNPAAVCIGSTINITPSATGGTWVVTPSTTASIVNGALKGIAAGKATVAYTLGTGNCSTTGTTVVTVEAAPVVTISGPAKICWNGRAMMRASVAGGVWNVENSALLLASPQGLFRNSVKPTTDNFKSGVNYTVTSPLGACSTKAVKAVYVRNVIAPSITLSATATSMKVNGTVTATATTTIAATGTWSTTNTTVSATANANTKTATIKGLKVGTGANVVYFADDATTGCRQAGYMAFSVTAAASMVDANQGSVATGVSVYPNPSNGVVTFENIAGAKSISLVDMTGRTVKTVAVNADRMTVNFSGVQNGKYLVQVAGENVNEVRSIVIE